MNSHHTDKQKKRISQLGEKKELKSKEASGKKEAGRPDGTDHRKYSKLTKPLQKDKDD